MQIMMEIESNVVKRVQSLSDIENNVAKVEAGLKELYPKCEISVVDLQNNLAAVETKVGGLGGDGSGGSGGGTDKRTKSYIPVKQQMRGCHLRRCS